MDWQVSMLTNLSIFIFSSLAGFQTLKCWHTNLGVPVGGNPLDHTFRNLSFEWFPSGLTYWRMLSFCKFLSLGRFLYIVSHCIMSLFLCIPVVIAQCMEKVMRGFFGNFAIPIKEEVWVYELGIVFENFLSSCICISPFFLRIFLIKKI